MPSSFPFTRRQALTGAVLILVVLVAGGRLLSRTGPEAAVTQEPPGIVTTAAAEQVTSTPVAEVVVDVVGAVRRPGLYRLPDGSRVADAVAEAGGTTPKAALAALNLAAPLVDGTQIVVPRRGAPEAAGTGGGNVPAPPAEAGPVHLNTATVEELDALPGIGPVTAQRIVDFREQNGPFRSVDELDAVPGIGPARLEQLRDLVAP
jgi:competence protein ComEA